MTSVAIALQQQQVCNFFVSRKIISGSCETIFSETNLVNEITVMLQIMASLLNQQKENINLAANLSSLGIPRAQPSMLNILVGF